MNIQHDSHCLIIMQDEHMKITDVIVTDSVRHAEAVQHAHYGVANDAHDDDLHEAIEGWLGCHVSLYRTDEITNLAGKEAHAQDAIAGRVRLGTVAEAFPW